MFPDAHIAMPEYIGNLIEAFMRRNMISTELKQEMAFLKEL